MNQDKVGLNEAGLVAVGNAVEQLEDGLVLYDSDIVRQHPEIRGR